MTPDNTEDQQWAELSTAQFLAGYADTDSTYDHLVRFGSRQFQNGTHSRLEPRLASRS